MINKRKATQIVRGQHAVDGAGVRLRRVLGTNNITDFDPFLMLDGFDSTDPDDYIKGFPWHPHRGIETITYLVKGKIEHGDSLGNKGTINDLECQWMTAGSGIIHQEMPKASERMLGCQLWVNMPAKDKMNHPAYGDITQDKVVV
ncbi:MAG: pirin family protein, partial [Clostridiales bacterium]|nr:pirin family protein [Clostridiales bacterium]